MVYVDVEMKKGHALRAATHRALRGVVVEETRTADRVRTRIRVPDSDLRWVKDWQAEKDSKVIRYTMVREDERTIRVCRHPIAAQVYRIECRGDTETRRDIRDAMRNRFEPDAPSFEKRIQNLARDARIDAARAEAKRIARRG